MGRAPALLILSAALVAWYETTPHLGSLSEWRSVAVVAVFLIPAIFGLVFLALPVSGGPWEAIAAGALVCVLLAVVLSAVHQPVFSNFAKLAAVTSVGWVFVRLFEELSWAVLVACVIPIIDAYSVWRGPTHTITEHHAAIFTSFSIAFVVPGGNSARLGLPDVFFFAVFLASSARFGLRPFATWLVMVAGLGATIVATTYWATNGLPALPAISFGFLAPNADLLLKSYRQRPRAAASG